MRWLGVLSSKLFGLVEKIFSSFFSPRSLPVRKQGLVAKQRKKLNKTKTKNDIYIERERPMLKVGFCAFVGFGRRDLFKRKSIV